MSRLHPLEKSQIPRLCGSDGFDITTLISPHLSPSHLPDCIQLPDRTALKNFDQNAGFCMLYFRSMLGLTPPRESIESSHTPSHHQMSGGRRFTSSRPMLTTFAVSYHACPGPVSEPVRPQVSDNLRTQTSTTFLRQSYARSRSVLLPSAQFADCVHMSIGCQGWSLEDDALFRPGKSALLSPMTDSTLHQVPQHGQLQRLDRQDPVSIVSLLPFPRHRRAACSRYVGGRTEGRENSCNAQFPTSLASAISRSEAHVQQHGSPLLPLICYVYCNL